MKKFETIDEYLSEVPEAQRKILEEVRQTVGGMVPEATETISYGMPGFKYKGRYLLGFAAFKDHMSLFPTSGPVEALGNELKSYKTSKGTIQFTERNNIPKKLLKKIITIQVEYIHNKNR